MLQWTVSVSPSPHDKRRTYPNKDLNCVSEDKPSAAEASAVQLIQNDVSLTLSFSEQTNPHYFALLSAIILLAWNNIEKYTFQESGC